MAISLVTLESRRTGPPTRVNIIGNKLTSQPKNLEGVTLTVGLKESLPTINRTKQKASPRKENKHTNLAIYTKYLQDLSGNQTTRWQQRGAPTELLPCEGMLECALSEVATGAEKSRVEVRSAPGKSGTAREEWQEIQGRLKITTKHGSGASQASG